MKRLAIILTAIIISALTISQAMAQNPEDIYYKGDRHYPIVFVQWGEGYIIDLHTVMEHGGDENTILADSHTVNMTTMRISPNTSFLAARYNEKEGTFQIAFQEAHGIVNFDNCQSFDESYLDRGNSETGFIFRAGLVMWEALKGSPFFKSDSSRLAKVPELGAPTFIRMDKSSCYSRLSHNRAVVRIDRKSGTEFLTVLFTPTYYIIEKASSQNKKAEAELNNSAGSMHEYTEDKYINLAKSYMGI